MRRLKTKALFFIDIPGNRVAVVVAWVLTSFRDHFVEFSPPQGRATTALPLPPNASILSSNPRQSFPPPLPSLVVTSPVAESIVHICNGVLMPSHAFACNAPARWLPAPEVELGRVDRSDREACGSACVDSSQRHCRASSTGPSWSPDLR